MQISSDRSYQFACSPDTFWQAAARTDTFRTWWPWLKTFQAAGLIAGDSWQCVVQPPLPYEVRFDLLLQKVTRPTTITARVTGDIVGVAGLDIAESATGCHVRLRSRLAPQNRVLRLVATVARPVAVYGHDWVLDAGARQFYQRALPTSPAQDAV